MRKNILIGLFLLTVTGVALIWSRQPAITSGEIIEEQRVEQAHNELPVIDAPVKESGRGVATESTQKPLTDKEKAFPAAQQTAFRESGIMEKMVENRNAVKTRLEKFEAQNTKLLNPNQRAKHLFNIDVVEDFGVDLNAEREKIRTNMRAKNDALLEQRLAALGVDPKTRKAYAARREFLSGTAEPE